MKKVLLSLLSIGAVAVVAVYATQAYFSDIETSKDNILQAGIVDIKVDGQNPWINTFTKELSDMKPCETKYIEFTIRNIWDSNPVEIWKHIKIAEESGGDAPYHCTCGGNNDVYVSSEPECYEGTKECTVPYVARDNMAAYIVYDLYVDPPGGNDVYEVIIHEDDEVRLDNISSSWIYLGKLQPGEEMKVKQSYHLMAWKDAVEEEITNWAQGDKVKFDIELYAEQLSGPGPEGVGTKSITLENKDSTTWKYKNGDPIDGKLTYNVSGLTFDYDLTASGLSDTEYCLIYYADPWPGDHPGALIGTHNAPGGSINVTGQSKDLGMDLPHTSDANYPAGAKIWLVPCSDYDDINMKLKAWNPDNYLFEMKMITYDDTDVP